MGSRKQRSKAASVGRLRETARSPSSTDLATVVIFVGWVWLAFVWEARFATFAPGGELRELPPLKAIPYGLLVVGSGLALVPRSARRRLRAAARSTTTATRLAKLLILSYLAIALTSALVSDDPFISSARLAQALIPLIAAIVWILVLERSPFVLLGGIIAAAAAHVVGTIWIWATGNRSVGYYAVEGGRWGAFQHPMAVGSGAAVIFVTSFWWALRKKIWLAWAGMLLAFTGFWLAKPRAAMVGAIVGSLFVAWKVLRDRISANQRGGWLGFLPVALAGGFVAALFLWTEHIMAWFSRGRTADQLATLSSRTHLWSEITEVAMERPLLGWGPGALRAGAIARAVKEDVGFGGSAHSAPFEVLLNIGLLGFLLWVGALAAIWALAARRNQSHAVLRRGLIVALLVDGLATAAVTGYGMPWMTFVVVGAWAWIDGAGGPAGATTKRRLPVLGEERPKPA